MDLWTKRAAAVFARDAATCARPRASVSGVLVPDAEFIESEFYRDFGRHHIGASAGAEKCPAVTDAGRG